MSVQLPTLNPLIVGDGSLLATWDNNNPYLPIKSASLIINTLTGQMYQRLLTSAQAYNGEYQINGLTNGTEYYVAYSFIAVDSSYNYLSNTVSNAPGAPPSDVSLNSLISINLGAIANVTVGNTNGYPVTDIVFLIFNESTGRLEVPPLAYPYDPSNNYLIPLQNFQEYDIACYAINNVGQSLLSNSLTVEASNLPNAPVITSVQTGGNAQALIRWARGPDNPNPPITIDAYTIYKAACAVDGSGNVITPSDSDYSSVVTLSFLPGTLDASLNYVVTGLTNGVLYSFKVSATDSPFGEGAKSVAKTGLPYGVLPTMNNLVPVTGNQSLNCTWDLATNQQFYNYSNAVTYNLDVSGNQYSTLDLSYNVTGLTNGLSYNVSLYGTYQIPQQLFNAINGSTPSQTVAGPSVLRVGIPYTVPNAPTNVSAILLSNSAMTLDWVAPVVNGGSIILSYSVYRYTDASYANLDASFNNIYSTELTMTGLTTRPYYFKVFAINAAGSSVAGTGGPFTPSNSIQPPTNLSLIQVANSTNLELILGWTSQNTIGYTATSYSIYQSDSNGERIGPFIDISANAYDSSNNPVTNPQQYTYSLDLTPIQTATATYYYRIQAVQNSPYVISVAAGATVTTGTTPTITSVYNDGSYNLVFTVNANGSALISLLILAPPTLYVASPTVYYSLTPTTVPALDATTGIFTYSITFGYPLGNIQMGQSNPQQYYFIAATNSVGCGVNENF